MYLNRSDAMISRHAVGLLRLIESQTALSTP